jgi:hypothetical protein
MGDQEPQHCITLRSAEHDVAKEPQRLRLQVSDVSRGVGVLSHEVGLPKNEIC